MLLGQRFWKVFIGLIAFGVAGGGTGYVMLYHMSGLPSWASTLIASGIGAAAGVLAYVFAFVGLILLAGFAGGVVTAIPLRAIAPTISPALRVGLVCLGAVLGGVLAGLGAYSTRPPAEEDRDGPVRPSTLMRLRASAKRNRKILEASVTSICGAYGVLICVNQWVYHAKATPACTPACHSFQLPGLLNLHAEMPACDLRCMALAIGTGALMIVGCAFQCIGICRASASRDDELRAGMLSESLTYADGAGGSADGSGGRPSALATRMRHKYCGGAAATAAMQQQQPISARAPQQPGGGPAPTWALAPTPVGSMQAAPPPPSPSGRRSPPGYRSATGPTPLQHAGSGTEVAGVPAPAAQSEVDDDPSLPAWARAR